MIPIGTDYKMTRIPWVNYALVAANVLIFVIGFNGGNIEKLPASSPLLLQPGNPQMSQFFTCIFLHASVPHLLGNMVFLWVFGNALNDRFGHLAYLAFYLAGGVLACVGYLLLSGNAPVLGASGAISAVAGAYLVLLPRVRVKVLMFFYFITYFEVSSLVFLMIQFVWNLWMSLSPGLTGLAAGGVAYAAHSSGYVFGIVVAIVLLMLRLLPRDAFDLLNLIRNAQRRGRYRRMVAQGYDPYKMHGALSRKASNTKRRVRSRTAETAVPDTPAAKELQIRREINDACLQSNLDVAAAKYLQLVQITENAVLPRQQQLDIANQLMASDQRPAAADAYERFIKHYGNYEHLADIYLMLGLLYSRYLQQRDRAERALIKAIELLDDPKKIEMAKGDLQKIQGHGSS